MKFSNVRSYLFFFFEKKLRDIDTQNLSLANAFIYHEFNYKIAVKSPYDITLNWVLLGM